ncbi:MAG: polysaccharide biosynthesis C-terminal domain-containing protein [Porphyromonadaceae bacterium]|nr:MAG: polysaccharide biosynthesis C-terminal domain-containing protein [Porphyromonadaceae bacterium]
MGFVFLLGAMSSSFFDLGYQCAKDTKRAIPAIILVAIINVASNLVITPLLGVHGVIISNFISYLVLGIYRFIDTKRYFKNLYISKHFRHDAYAGIRHSLILIGCCKYGTFYSFCNSGNYINMHCPKRAQIYGDKQIE